jgi:hypothetical protein
MSSSARSMRRSDARQEFRLGFSKFFDEQYAQRDPYGIHRVEKPRRNPCRAPLTGLLSSHDTPVRWEGRVCAPPTVSRCVEGKSFRLSMRTPEEPQEIGGGAHTWPHADEPIELRETGSGAYLRA